jgi:hypothetical protein
MDTYSIPSTLAAGVFMHPMDAFPFGVLCNQLRKLGEWIPCPPSLPHLPRHLPPPSPLPHPLLPPLPPPHLFIISLLLLLLDSPPHFQDCRGSPVGQMTCGIPSWRLV